MTIKRRQFLQTSSLTTAHLALFGLPIHNLNCQTTKPMTVQEVIDTIVALVPGGAQVDTVDTIKSGNGQQLCSGIVTTFMATSEVIQKTIDLKANFIITHEPTFYNHLDETEWLQQDQVFQFKKKLLDQNEIAVWRFHDYWHSIVPDGILTGITSLLGWEQYQEEPNSIFFQLPQASLLGLADQIKNTMGLKRPFLVGNPQMPTAKVALLPGAWGGRNQIETFINSDIDALIVGEINEWETNEYIRDAQFAGFNKGLIIMGHAISEEPGMQYLTEWLKPLTGGVPLHHVPAGDALLAV